MKKVCIRHGTQYHWDKHNARFDKKNVDLTLHPVDKDYGMMLVPGTRTPFTKKVKSIDPGLLRRRLYQILFVSALQKKDKNEDYSEIISSSSENSNDFIYSSRYSVEGELIKKRNRIEKNEYALKKFGKDMRLIMHEAGERIPGVTKVFPQVSWPEEEPLAEPDE